MFEDFWKAYPRKIGKLAAQKAWAKAIKISKPAEIIAGIAPYMENKPDWQDFCHPATFLNQGRWMDEYEQPAQRVTTARSGSQVYDSDRGWIPLSEYLN